MKEKAMRKEQRYDHPDDLPFERVFNERMLNVSFSMKHVEQCIKDAIMRFNLDIETLAKLPEFGFEATQVYLRSFDLNQAYMTFNVTFASDQADWISENVLSFRKVESTGVGGLLEGLKLYPYKYPYRYANQNASGSIVNNAVMPSDFMLRIYGAISNPLVMIGSSNIF